MKGERGERERGVKTVLSYFIARLRIYYPFDLLHLFTNSVCKPPLHQQPRKREDTGNVTLEIRVYTCTTAK